MPDVWSYCSECERWYYSAPAASNRCPACEAEPSAREDRAAAREDRAAAAAGSMSGAPLVGSAQS